MCLTGAGFLTANAQAPRQTIAQPGTNLRKKMISTRQSYPIDTLSIVPKTVQILGMPDSIFVVDWVNAIISWKRPPAVDSVLVSYRVFPARLNAAVRRMSFDTVMNNFMGQPFIPDYGTNERDNRFFNFGNLTYNGSFGRGISFGNSQDAVLTSNLNLQLSGYLADSIEILAAITDNNIPIQPDGTTQQLNEFDRIYLQFRKKNWQLSLGDIDLRQQQSYFLNFYKRLQGVAFETTTPLGKKAIARTLVSGSIAKGKFTRNIFQGQEGNQGPYRLEGANNEFFFVVLANTERVFIDGELLQRGEDQDYVINYNTAEVTFTPRRMITKDKRIQIEFEYADRNYLNANLYAFNETSFGEKAKVRVGFFSNTDVKSSPINQTLNPEQKDFLGLLGDSIQRAFYPNSAVDTFVTGKILYRRVDSIFNSGLERDSVFIYSTDADSTLYSLSFIEVGQGNGNYLPEFNGANGKVYRWIEPINGVRQGRFEPAIFLVTPKKQQVLTVGFDYALGKNTMLYGEGARSTYDVNLFSTLDKKNKFGYATKWQLRNIKTIGRKERGLKLVTEGGYEWVEATFKPLERLRNVEFTRDWGLPLVVTPQDEAIVTAGVQLTDLKANSLKYQFTNYHRGDGFNGVRNSLAHLQQNKWWRFNNLFMVSHVKSDLYQGYFLRPTVNVTRLFPKWNNYSLTGSYWLEHNAIKVRATDTMAIQSFSFQTIQFALKSDDAKPNKWSIIYFTRTDAYPLGKELVKSDRSQNVTLTSELLKSEKHQFRLSATYRNLDVLRDSISRLKSDNSVLARAEYNINEWKGLVTGNVLYELGAGQEQKRDITFVEVPAGQGEYTWNDYNGDGIQQLNEFEIALFRDQAKYIRIFTPTNEFVKANYNTFNYSISLNPRAVINLSKAKGVRLFVSKINVQSSLQINKKELNTGSLQLNPFGSSVSDTSLIILNSVFVNTFSFNRFSSKWGLDFNNTRNSTKALLTYGYESRVLQDWSGKGRINITRSILVDLTGRTGFNQLLNSNPKFGNRNYNIRQNVAEPRISLTKGSVLRVILGYRLSDRKNSEGDKEKSVTHSFNSEVKYNILQSTSIQTKFTYSSISFTSLNAVPNANSPAAYIMLDGLLPGKNFLWTVDLTRRLSNNLELNIQYEGRKPGSAKVVHVGRASIRALL
ncbi:MAG: hypothetical protein H7Y31_18595 [Chitinophagaceae bacterium]|nr:hypothetical protein [Chitinophagaceae bacterium]